MGKPKKSPLRKTAKKPLDPIPVTLLSGFLGAGKTTLLQHILRNKENLRCAIIVNDMAALNIDAELISQAEILQRDEKMIEMQNGCICCTLREDLLEEIAKIASSRKFEYIIIESTGISEPMQVAETFVLTADDLAGTKEVTSLEKLARLDTCVTVVDATNFLDLFEALLQSFPRAHQCVFYRRFRRRKTSLPNGDRSVVDLLVDQVEFANVILLNKCDCVSPATLQKATAVLKALNPSADILPTRYSQVPLKNVLNTGKFNYDVAAQSPGWLQSLQTAHVPETLEYGISSFVYRASRPFHPQRLFDLLVRFFVVLEYGGPGEASDDEEEGDAEQPPTCSMDASTEQKDTMMIPEHILRERLSAKKQSIFASLYRSKGFLWLATRPQHRGEWAQAGTMLSIQSAGYWDCVEEEEVEREEGGEGGREDVHEMDDDDQQVLQAMDEDADLVGDRRQELVFIGDFTTPITLDDGTQCVDIREALISALTSCLVRDDEWEVVKQVMRRMNREEEESQEPDRRALREDDLPSFWKEMSDPWEDWDTDDADHDHDHDHDHEDH